MRAIFIALLFFAFAPGRISAAEDPIGPFQGIRLAPQTGWTNSFHLEGASGNVRLAIAPEVGGRIVHYSLGGENIIFENPAGFGKTLATARSGFWVGGYQIDIGPEIRGIPPHDELWRGPWSGGAIRDYSLRLASLTNAATGIQLEKEITFDADTGDVGILHRMRNHGEHETAYCLWDRTLCRGGGFALIPLTKKSRFPGRWSVRYKQGDKLYYDGDKPSLPDVKILDNVLVAQCQGEATKLGADSEAGWIAYTKGKVLFVKYFPTFAKGDYTDGGNSVELYYDRNVAELEPLSPEIKLLPYASYEFAEKWVLIDLEEEVISHEQARKLVKRIPPSPFKRQ